jgi:hypothetical protein
MMNHNPQDRPAPAESLAQLNSIAALMSSPRRTTPMWKKKHFFDYLTQRLLGGYFPNTPYLWGAAS